MTCNIPVDDDKTPTSSKFPKNIFSYIKSQKSESSNIATLRQNGQLHSDNQLLWYKLQRFSLDKRLSYRQNTNGYP